MGVTLVDSLDTLWLMGLKEEFFEGRLVVCVCVRFVISVMYTVDDPL